MTTARTLPSLIAFMPTPTLDGGKIDTKGFESLMQRLMDHGVGAFAVFGSTGAIGSFTEDERKHLAEIAVQRAKGRAAVMIGTGAMTTEETVRLSRHAEKVGADCALVVPITYWLLTEDEVISHFSAIGRAITTPICIYNNPRLTGVDMIPSTVAKLSEVSNVGYLKESSPELARIAQTKRLVGDRLKVYAGRDDTGFDGLCIGADGLASALVCLFPQTVQHVVRLFQSGNITAARALGMRMAPMVEFIMQKGLVRTIHAALELEGHPVGAPRAPIGSLGKADYEKLGSLLPIGRAIEQELAQSTAVDTAA